MWRLKGAPFSYLTPKSPKSKWFIFFFCLQIMRFSLLIFTPVNSHSKCCGYLNLYRTTGMLHNWQWMNVETQSLYLMRIFRWSPLPHLQQSLQRRKGWRQRRAVSQKPVKKLQSRSKQRWTWTKA